MQNQTNKLAPKLRFKEFSQDWEEKKFGEIYTFLQTNSFSRALLNYENGKVKNIHYGDIHTKFQTNFYLKNEEVPYINSDINLENIKNENYCKERDLIIADASEDYKDIGKTIEIIDLNNEQLLAGLHTFIARDEKSIMAKGFGGFLMQTQDVRLQMMKIATGISVLGISKNNLSKINLNLPTLQEQEKIADFLSAVDEKIEILSKKDELLNDYKKGVSQQIFNQKLRFKDENGENFPDWKEKELSEILKERKLFATKDEQYEHISLTTQGIIPKSQRYERDFLVSDDSIKKYKVTKIDDICYNPANLKFGVICRNNYGAGIFSPIYITFEVHNENIKFIEYFLIRKDFINQVRKFEEGTVYERQAVKPEDLLKFKIKIPALKEQEKIAEFLSEIDDKIQNNKKTLELNKEFKKALLQQMFG